MKKKNTADLVKEAIRMKIMTHQMLMEQWRDGDEESRQPKIDETLSDIDATIDAFFLLREALLDSWFEHAESRMRSILADEPLDRIYLELELLRDKLGLISGKSPRVKAPISSSTWSAYEKAFEIRYKTKPIRNATVNGQLANFVRRVGEELAPKVIVFYVNHRAAFYTQAMHPIGLAVRDAEKLAAEFQSGRMVTQTQARQEDARGANAGLVKQILEGEI